MPDMRFAPPNPIRIADRSAGLNAVSVRGHNERLVLSLLLRHGGMSRMALGEKSGLSAQTVSVIVRSMEKEGLIASGEAQKGRVGPPTIPVSLNADGVSAVGISVGFRKTDVVLIDFLGHVTASAELAHETLGYHHVHPQIFATVSGLIRALPKRKQDRIAGIGLALPDGFEDSPELAQLQGQLETLGLEVFVQNDVTSAAAGESMFGAARPLENYLFFYVGAHVHSRLILNHHILRSGVNASYDVGLLELERRLGSNAATSAEFWKTTLGPATDAPVQAWIEDCGALIQDKAAQANQFVQVDTVVVSSYLPRPLIEGLCDTLGPLKGVVGEVAQAPKAVGAASLAFSSRFLI